MKLNSLKKTNVINANNRECSTDNQLYQCPEYFAGLHCQVAEVIIEPSFSEPKEFSIELNDLKYFQSKLPNDYSNMQKHHRLKNQQNLSITGFGSIKISFLYLLMLPRLKD